MILQSITEALATTAVKYAGADKPMPTIEFVMHPNKLKDACLEAGWINPDDISQASLDIIQERDRQQDEEGWTPEHDDNHAPGEMSLAAACYAIASFHDANYRDDGTPVGWPWDAAWWKPKDARANLVRAGALIIAEIERIDRAADQHN